MCNIEKSCFVPAFSLPFNHFPKQKYTTKQSTDSLLLSRKYLLKWQEKHFISGKRSTENVNQRQKFHPSA